MISPDDKECNVFQFDLDCLFSLNKNNNNKYMDVVHFLTLMKDDLKLTRLKNDLSNFYSSMY